MRIAGCLSAALAAALFAAGPSAHEPPAGGIDPGRAIDAGLGPLQHPVSTRNAQAQAFFDQGLKLVFAFNHEGAVASFRRAAELDPELAMAHWGMALALGPNYNLPMSPEAHQAAYGALGRAIALKGRASAAEQAYIDALARRYSSTPEADPGPLNAAYAAAMAELARRFPNDVDAQVLYAESLMNLRPWKLHLPDGRPAEGTDRIIAVLEDALRKRPAHIGANHYYIHAVEMSAEPERALESARRLETLAPSAGHLVHMPAHTYIRTGRYLDAARVNEKAVAADERLRAAGVQSLYTVGYYGHNLHFLAVCYALAGNFARSIAAANKLAEVVRPRLKDVPFLDLFYATPAQVLVLFERWEAILAMPEPPFEAPMSGALWRFARALAFGSRGQVKEAHAERELLLKAIATLPPTLEFGTNAAPAVMAVALPYLDGRLALLAGDLPAATRDLRAAAAAEDRLNYDEPPGWYLGSYLMLGHALLRAGDAAGAEQALRAELKRNVASGRALFALQMALKAQGNDRLALRAQRQFNQAWIGADTRLAATR
jgi:tetratricopeptide (TPR) repeat protein